MNRVAEAEARATETLRELEATQGRLASSDGALQEAMNRVAVAEGSASEAQRALEQAQLGRREAQRIVDDVLARLEVARRQAADLQSALNGVLERSREDAELRARNISELNAALAVSQEKLREEAVRAARAMDEVERLSTECRQLKRDLQELQAARQKWDGEVSSRFGRLSKTALDALRGASELVRQSNDKLARYAERMSEVERQHADMLHRALPAWVPFDHLGNDERAGRSWRNLKVRRLVANWQTSRLVTKADEANKGRNWPVAAACYARALAKSPSLAPIWVQYGHALKELGDRGMAEVAYREAIRLEPNNPDTHLQLGHLLKLLGRVEAARAAFQRSAELDPSQVHIRRELALLAEPQGKPSFDFLDNAMQAIMREAAGSDAAHQKM
jgi:tetratricopeptide (TPR) repeat protein